MPAFFDHDMNAQPCLVVSAENCSAKKAGVKDDAVILPPALQVTTLTAQEAEVIRDVLNKREHPTHQGREMPTGDPSDLLRKDR